MIKEELNIIEISDVGDEMMVKVVYYHEDGVDRFFINKDKSVWRYTFCYNNDEDFVWYKSSTMNVSARVKLTKSRDKLAEKVLLLFDKECQGVVR